MKKLMILLGFLSCLRATPAWAGGPDPRERNFKFLVDGVEIDGVIGYRIEFNRLPVTRTDSRRLDLAYSPDQRRLVLTVTEKGLNRLQDWLNGATDTGTPVSKNVSIQARDNREELLARWELTGVTPSAFSSAAAGNINELAATIEFVFERLRLVEARGK